MHSIQNLSVRLWKLDSYYQWFSGLFYGDEDFAEFPFSAT